MPIIQETTRKSKKTRQPTNLKSMLRKSATQHRLPYTRASPSHHLRRLYRTLVQQYTVAIIFYLSETVIEKNKKHYFFFLLNNRICHIGKEIFRTAGRVMLGNAM